MIPITTQVVIRKPAFITLELEGSSNQNTIKLKFSSLSNSTDISWNINKQEFIVDPNSYIYIGGSKNPSIPAAINFIAVNNPIKYELRGQLKEILPSSGVDDFVSIFMVDNNYVIRPNISGKDLFIKTGMMGYWKFSIMAS
jgi:hypothetical protein